MSYFPLLLGSSKVYVYTFLTRKSTTQPLGMTHCCGQSPLTPETPRAILLFRPTPTSCWRLVLQAVRVWSLENGCHRKYESSGFMNLKRLLACRLAESHKTNIRGFCFVCFKTNHIAPINTSGILPVKSWDGPNQWSKGWSHGGS